MAHAKPISTLRINTAIQHQNNLDTSRVVTFNLKLNQTQLSAFVLGSALALCTNIWAQPGVTSSAASAPVPGLAVETTRLKPLSSPSWAKLSQSQKTALQPLSASWESLNELQKRKWISLSSNFSTLKTSDQSKLHSRMAQWAALTPKQRQHARLNFAEVQKIPLLKKNEQWQAYQALSPEQQQKLAKSAPPKPPRTALTLKPITPSTLNKMVDKRSKARSNPPGTAASHALALLPRPTPPAAPTPPTRPLVADEPRQP